MLTGLFFVLGILLLLLLSGFFSGSETALYSLTPFDLHQMEEQKRWGFKRVRWLLERPRRLLIAILLSNLVVNVLISSIVERRMANLFPEGGGWALLISILFSTGIVILFGEVLPKIVGLRQNRFLASAASQILFWLYLLLWIPVELLAHLAGFVSSLFGTPPVEAATEEEIKTMVSDRAERGVLGRGERDMIHSIFNLDRVPVARIMTPRVKIAALSIGMTGEEILAYIQEHRFSRLPVYRGSIDNILGVLSVKDLLPLAAKGETIHLRRHLRPAVFVPRSRRVDDLIQDLQRRRLHMAVVVDEDGSTAGLVTLEDAVEEVVGEIHDERDVEVPS